MENPDPSGDLRMEASSRGSIAVENEEEQDETKNDDDKSDNDDDDSNGKCSSASETQTNSNDIKQSNENNNNNNNNKSNGPVNDRRRNNRNNCQNETTNTNLQAPGFPNSNSSLLPPPYSEFIDNQPTQESHTSRPVRRISKGRVSFDLGYGNSPNTLQEPKEERRRKISREMAVQTDKGPRVSFCFDQHPFFPEKTPPSEQRERKLSGILVNGSTPSGEQRERKLSGILVNGSTPSGEQRERKLSGILVNGSSGGGARPKTPSPRVSFSMDHPDNIFRDSAERSESIFHDSAERSEYESSLSQDPPRRQSRQRRSGVVHTPHMGMTEDTKFDVDESRYGDAPGGKDSASNGCQSPEGSEGDDTIEDRLRKASYSSEAELGRINHCFRDDDFVVEPGRINHCFRVDDDLELMQKRVGRWTVGDYIGDSASETSGKDDLDTSGNSQLHKSVSVESIPMSTQTEDTLIRPIKKTKQNGTKSILKKTSKEFLPIILDENVTPVIEKSKNKNDLAHHVRKDSIALTSEKMGQIKEIRRKYSGNSVHPVWKRQKECMRKYQLHLFVGGLLGFLIIIVSVGWHFHAKATDFKQENQKIHIDPSDRKIVVGKPKDADDLQGTIGASIPKWQTPYHCLDEPETLDFVCLKWKDQAILRVRHYGASDMNCYNMTWTPLSTSVFPEDCYDIGSAVWYGPSNLTDRSWTLTTADNFYYTSGNLGYYTSGTFDSTADYAWISSKGGMIVVDKNSPLFVKWNSQGDGKICIGARYQGLYYGSYTEEFSHLKYTICNANDIIDAMQHSRSFTQQNSSRKTPDDLLKYPAFTGSKYSKSESVGEEDIRKTLRELRSFNLSCSSIVVNGKWENAIGDFSFNDNTFPNITEMIGNIHEAGMTVRVEISPYISYKSVHFEPGYREGKFVLGGANRVPGLIRVANSLSAVLDLSDNTTASWIQNKTGELTALGVDSFHFRLSTDNWLPYKPFLQQRDIGPNRIREMFVTALGSGTSISANAIAYTQSLNHVVSIPTKLSTDAQNVTCITGVIETALTLGILGYPLVSVDGTFEFSKTYTGEIPNLGRDLYERWIQLATFFPTFKYNVPPWHFGNQTVLKAKKMADLHQRLVFPEIKSFEGKMYNDSVAFINPIWLFDPWDSVAHTVSDQFVVGDTILVAPVLCENTVARDIYIPKGIWSDPKTGALVKGGHWLRGYKADADTVPYFIRKEVYGERPW